MSLFDISLMIIKELKYLRKSLFPGSYSNWYAKPSIGCKFFRRRISRKSSAFVNTASLTVECALVFPILLAFFLGMFWMIELFEIHSDIGSELYSAGNELVSYSFCLNKDFDKQKADESLLKQLGTIGFNEVFIKKRLSSAKSASKVKYLNTLLSDVKTKGEIDIEVTYYAVPYIPIPGIHGIWLTNHFYSKAYTGAELSGNKEDEEDVIVYITPNGKVYHTSINCSTLKTTISAVRYSELSNERNDSGAKYYPCEYCGGKVKDGTVYITPTGRRYHSSLQCGELRTSISEIKLSQVGSRRKCMRCP